MDHVCAVALFKNKKNNKYFLLGNTHLFWDPSYAHLKLHQAYLVSVKLDQLRKTWTEKLGEKNIPVILCGDFNSKPKSAVHKFLLSGVTPKKESDLHLFVTPPSSELSFKSSYKEFMKNEPPFTNFTDSFVSTLDYIFYDGSLTLKEILSLPNEEFVKKSVALPSIEFPSDHLSIGAKFCFED